MANKTQLKFLLSTVQQLQMRHIEDCEMSIETECGGPNFSVTVSNLCTNNDGERKVFKFTTDDDGDDLIDKVKEIREMIEL